MTKTQKLKTGFIWKEDLNISVWVCVCIEKYVWSLLLVHSVSRKRIRFSSSELSLRLKPCHGSEYKSLLIKQTEAWDKKGGEHLTQEAVEKPPGIPSMCKRTLKSLSQPSHPRIQPCLWAWALKHLRSLPNWPSFIKPWMDHSVL